MVSYRQIKEEQIRQLADTLTQYGYRLVETYYHMDGLAMMCPPTDADLKELADTICQPHFVTGKWTFAKEPNIDDFYRLEITYLDQGGEPYPVGDLSYRNREVGDILNPNPNFMGPHFTNQITGIVDFAQLPHLEQVLKATCRALAESSKELPWKQPKNEES